MIAQDNPNMRTADKSNLDLYNRVKQPPENALKQFSNGKFSGTDINPMWRIRTLTEVFGVCGFGWYTKVNRYWTESASDGSIAVFCELELYVKMNGEWSKPVVGVGGNTFERKTRNGSSVSDEAYKMAYTDALSIACKALGFGADIWWKYDETKYTKNQQKEDNQEAEIVCEACGKTIKETLIDGKRWSAEKVATATRNKYGKTMCYSCKLKADRRDNQPEYDPKAVQEVVEGVSP